MSSRQLTQNFLILISRWILETLINIDFQKNYILHGNKSQVCQFCQEATNVVDRALGTAACEENTVSTTKGLGVGNPDRSRSLESVHAAATDRLMLQ